MAKKDLNDMTGKELMALAKKEYSLNLSKTYPKAHMITLIEAAQRKADENKPKKDEKKKDGEH